MSNLSSPCPADVTNALSRDNFEQDRCAFWDLCNFMMHNYTGRNGISAPVWKQIDHPHQTAMILLRKLVTVLETAQIEEMDQKKLTIYNTYLIILCILRGTKTVTEWMAHEQHDTLKSMNYLYGTLTQIKAREHKLMPVTFGQIP